MIDLSVGLSEHKFCILYQFCRNTKCFGDKSEMKTRTDWADLKVLKWTWVFCYPPVGKERFYLPNRRNWEKVWKCVILARNKIQWSWEVEEKIVWCKKGISQLTLFPSGHGIIFLEDLLRCPHLVKGLGEMVFLNGPIFRCVNKRPVMGVNAKAERPHTKYLSNL